MSVHGNATDRLPGVTDSEGPRVNDKECSTLFIRTLACAVVVVIPKGRGGVARDRVGQKKHIPKRFGKKHAVH